MKRVRTIISARAPSPLLKSESGISLVLVLVVMTIVGLSAGLAGSSWSSLVRRAREADLLWKGDQIRRAIGSYYLSSHGQGASRIFPSKLDYLLKDPRFLETRRHLRRLYPDPMTGQDWELIKDKGGRIKGVRSSLAEEPFKQGNFSEENKDFEGRGLYSEWEFVYIPQKKKQVSGQSSVENRSQPSGSVAPSTGGQ
ncbi:MAG: type II secretion system GspH family protein [Geopsychrobacter sp.]|nr:type II secretion system GspH family protein [Geopsychrobacter sp.]